MSPARKISAKNAAPRAPGLSTASILIPFLIILALDLLSVREVGGGF